MKLKLFLAGLSAAALFLAASALAGSENPKGKGKPGADKAQHQHQRDHGSDSLVEDVVVGLVYAGISQSAARELALSHNVTGYKPLPPGIRKNLARGKPLPPGIARQSVPGSLLAALPHHEGYEWRRSGTDLILVSIASAVIAEVLIDVFE
ncbi:MAG: RcnB family protein [Porticoccaceae bacterium]|jgi:hypothetical protein|nr:RcnB family protein [Porticoccaceae bacterium]